jgi:hypothetical protein
MSTQRESFLLLLPAELRLRIYEHVIGSCTVYVRMKWTGICTPAGFKYSRLNDRGALLMHSENKILAQSVPFGSDVRNLASTCRQIQEESTCLPFKTYTWAFESAFTLDQWVSMKCQVPKHLKATIKTVAMPSPGPSKSSERSLLNMREIHLIGFFNSSSDADTAEPDPGPSNQVMITLKKDKASGNWTRSDG